MTASWHYEEARAPAPLARHVAAFWHMRGAASPGSGAVHRVLPDGCIDFIFDLGAAPAVTIVGAMTTALALPLTAGFDAFGIRFRPGGALPWLRVPAGQLTDLTVGMSDCSLHPPARLLDALRATRSIEARTHLAAGWLQSSAGSTRDDFPLFTAARMLASGPQSVREAAQRLGMSERTLERSFQAGVGLTPGQFRGIARLRRLLASLGGAGAVSLADAAAEAGYYDQPHLDREFRRLVGCAPRQWLTTRVGFVQDSTVAVL